MSREEFHGQLEAIRGALADMCELAGTAMERATTALLAGDHAVAAGVAELAVRLDIGRRAIEDQSYEVLALQAPVAVDLRALVMAIKAAADVDRMGSLANHIAKVAVRRHPTVTVPDSMFAIFRKMSAVGVRMAAGASAVLESADVTDARRLAVDDDAMNGLRRSLFLTLLDDWPYGVGSAIDVALLGRYYERFADHAVAIADGVVYMVTGDLPIERDERIG